MSSRLNVVPQIGSSKNVGEGLKYEILVFHKQETTGAC
jgi:hypothetical protein